MSFLTALVLPNANYHIIVGCDGLSALDKIGIPQSTVRTNVKDADLISYAVDLVENSKFTLHKRHVYGHKDKSQFYGPLTFLEHLNCRMDNLAKNIACSTIPPTNHIPATSTVTIGLGTIHHHGTFITSKIQKSLYSVTLHSIFLTYISEKFSIPYSILKHSICWPSFKRARKNSTFPMQKIITKWICNDCATGVVMVRRKHRLTSECLRYGHEKEDNLRILLCKDPSLMEYRSTILLDLSRWLDSMDTDPQLTNFFISGLSFWFINEPFASPIDTTNSPTLSLACNLQLSLGWRATLHGLISRDIITCQQEFYTSINSEKLVLCGAQD